MSDLERRLRDALHAAAEPAPTGLVQAVLRRHRRRRWRVGAGLVAVGSALALALPPAISTLHGGAPVGSTPRRTVSRTARPPVAAPGTTLAGCGSANLGSIGAHWQRGATTRAGHVWFIDGGHGPVPRAQRPPGERLNLYVAVIVLDRTVKRRSVVVLRVAKAGRPYLRFLYGANDSLNPGTHYSMRSGESGVTFVACPVPPGITNYYGGYLVRGARCVPVLAWMPGVAKPVAFRLGACPGRSRQPHP
jgi:hypothetical protein